MHVRPIVLSIAGSDSSGGAGIQADLKTIEACGGWGATAIVAVTAQSPRGVLRQTVLEPEIVRAQIAAVLDDLPVQAIKTGMLGDAVAVIAVASALASARAPIVCDPVVRASTGAPLLDDAGVRLLRERILPLARLVTPNAAEAECLTGLPVRTLDDAERAGRRLLALGARAALVTGGHLEGERAIDLLVEPAGATRFDGERVRADATHGTGCTLSAAIATHLAHGRTLADAIGRAKQFVTDALRAGHALGVDPLHAWHAAIRVAR
jgi:hydroxymethylpyrimidine/phosphomethylpyrimidine kinase